MPTRSRTSITRLRWAALARRSQPSSVYMPMVTTCSTVMG